MIGWGRPGAVNRGYAERAGKRKAVFKLAGTRPEQKSIEAAQGAEPGQSVAAAIGAGAKAEPRAADCRGSQGRKMGSFPVVRAVKTRKLWAGWGLE
jgi:hypothetical protein